jgi:hypothetical protein
MQKYLEAGFVPVNLTEGNVKVGDRVLSRRELFGTLVKITPKGNYAVRFDVDYLGEPTTKFTPELFEEMFLVDKRLQK